MNDRITEAITRLFKKHRIVFWYDAKQELRDEYESLDISDVEKIEISNNEYAIKYRMLREQRGQKFLIFRDGPQPPDIDNWLLDVQLAHGEFRTDQVAIWLAELELGFEFTELVQTHAEFFHATKRKDNLKKLLKSEDTASQIRLKMLAVCAGSDCSIDSVLEYLLQELADDRDDKINLIKRCALDVPLWEYVRRQYGYESLEPGVRDFAIALFKSCYAMGTSETGSLGNDALAFLKRWKDSRQFESAFEKISQECAEVLSIESDLATRDFRDLIQLDYFRLIDQKILSDLVREVAASIVSGGDVALWLRERKQSHWYAEFRHPYEAIEVASRFMTTLNEVSLSMTSITDAVQRYSTNWYQLDQLYRIFIYHMRACGQTSLLSRLSEQIENLYTNNYLLKLGNKFQSLVDATDTWNVPQILSQRDFYTQRVLPYIKKDTRVCVIISDAMRYEVGEELLRRIRSEDRYSAELQPAVATLPSYTQLGMAALLPHTELAIAENDTGIVMVDGRSSQGTSNRGKILVQGTKVRSKAVQAKDIMTLTGDESRALVREHDVLYVYHNRIDHTGDKRESEEQVFDVVEDTLQELVRLVKKLTGANANNLLITADHGFIYQHRAIDESDFAGGDVEGDQILYRDRRFILGKGLREGHSLRKFKSTQLGLGGDMEVLIPKSINRLRLQGSGSRFVHGGATLQEVVIPVLQINKKRQSDIAAVSVDILQGGSSVITSGQLSVTLYQSGPVTDKIQPRILRAGFYTQGGELISDTHDLRFDIRSDNPRDREQQVRFVFTRKADEANGQEVILKLQESHAGTSHYKEYKSVRYIMRRSFTSDFDF